MSQLFSGIVHNDIFQAQASLADVNQPPNNGFIVQTQFGIEEG